MKNTLVALTLLFLWSCGGKDWNITADQFMYQNLDEFNVDYSLLENESNGIENEKFLDYWYNTIYDGQSIDDILNKRSTTTSYFSSWQTREASTFIEFTIASKSDCELDVYYVIMDGSGNVLNHYLVAYDYTCPGVDYSVATTLNNDGSFSKHEFEKVDSYSYKLEKVTNCKISNEGVFLCGDPSNIDPVVCLWEKLTIKETPSVKGKYVTSVFQGEILIYLNESSIDEDSKDNVEYIKVQLSDGTVGWVQSRFVAVKAGVGMFINKSFMYSRPNEINKLDNFFSQMDIVAVLEYSEDREWAKVKGKPEHENWFKENWVKTGLLSTYKLDVKVAFLMKSALKLESKEEQLNQLETIVNNQEFEGLYLIQKVVDQIAELSNDEDRKTLKLKWKQVTIDQYASTYLFENEQGIEVSFGYIRTEEKNYDPTLYYTWYESEESMFGRHEINEDVVDKWFLITVEIQKVQAELSDDMVDTNVIIKIEPVE